MRGFLISTAKGLAHNTLASLSRRGFSQSMASRNHGVVAHKANAAVDKTEERNTFMKNYKQILNNLLNDESGQDLIEYALVAALIALGAVTVMKGVATNIGTIFTGISTNLTNA